MGRNYRAIDFDEDHQPGQKLIEIYNRTCDHTHVVYVDTDGSTHEVLSGSDPMILALLKLLQNRESETREPTDTEMQIAFETVYKSNFR